MNIKEKTTTYLKSLAAETVSNAKSGHTGSALGASSIMLSLFHEHLKFDSDALSFWREKNTDVSATTGNTALGYLNRDRLVFSAGHTSALVYSLLCLFGYDVSFEDLKQFRKINSKTPGHPEYGIVPGVETTTGPLGQGVANAVGMALAESILESKFNCYGKKIFDYHTYCYAGEGCLMEGVAVEACSLAGTLNLNKFILLYDDNGNTIDGTIDLENREDVAKKFEAMGFNVIKVAKGNDYDSCSAAIAQAKNSDKPTIIIFKTIIGIGTKAENNCAAHAMPLSESDLLEFKAKLGVEKSFDVPEDVKSFCQKATTNCKKQKQSWLKLLSEEKRKNSEFAAEFDRFFSKESINYSEILKTLSLSAIKSGREISSSVLNFAAKNMSNLFGGTGDVAPSTMAYIEGGGDYSAENRSGRNIHFGIREHAMGAISNGLALSGITCFDSTFMAFSNYMIPPLKMRAMMGIKILSVFSHDSIDVGQDGPTHQPIEQIGALRQIIGLNVFRPATEAELVAAYKCFFEGNKPIALIVSKNKLMRCTSSNMANASRGAYIAYDCEGTDKIEIFATGRELALAIEVAQNLNKKHHGVRVISMPCEEIFSTQSEAYKNKVLLNSPTLRVAIEASDDNMWYKYIGIDGEFVGVKDYNSSGDGNEVYSSAGFNCNAVIKRILKRLK